MTPRRTATTGAFLLILLTLGSACGSPGEAPSDELEPLSGTHWTDKTELFMEHPPLVAGQSALFAVHLTRMADFTALNAGRPRLEFVPEAGGTPTVVNGSPPSKMRPGVFRIEAAAPVAGRYKWSLIIEAPGLTDRHDLGTITVFADREAAKAGAEQPSEDSAAFAYLKEQQWTNEFATALVSESDLRTAVRVPASIEPLTGGEAIVAAPAPGRFTADSLLSLGATVRSGQALGQLEPRLSSGGDDRATLSAAVAEAQAAVDAARAEQGRAERLLADRAVPARRVEEAHRAAAVAEARLAAAQARLAQRDETLRTGSGAAAGNTFVLRAPIAGRLAEVFATLGASYEEGAPLFRIVRTDRVELRALVPAVDAPLTRGVNSIAFEVPGRSDPVILDPHHAHDAGVIDPATRALAVQFEVDNPGGQLLIGQTGTALLYKAETLRVPAVPKAAVLMEAGRPYVFVQAGGESFVRRYIEIASRDGDLVGVRSGLALGDRVVTKGAYDVQLASAAKGLPAEGHVH